MNYELDRMMKIKKILFVSTRTILLVVVYMAILTILPIILLMSGYFSTSINSMIVAVWVLLLLVTGYLIIFDRKIIITSEAVIYHSIWGTKKLKWEEIKEIGIVYYSPYPVSSSVKYVCISPITGTSGRMVHQFSKECIYFNWREAAINLLNEHWDEVIGDN